MVFSGRTDEDEFIERATEEAEEKWKRILEIDGGRNEHDKTARAKGVLEDSQKAAFIRDWYAARLAGGNNIVLNATL